MDKLSSILKEWENKKDIELLLQQDVFRDMNAIQQSLSALPLQDRESAENTLRTLISALECHLEDLNAERGDVKSQIDKNLKSARACLSYGSALGLGNNKSRK